MASEYSLVAKLRADVAYVDIVQGLMCLQVTDLDNEGVGTKVLAIDEQLGHNNGVVGGATK